MSSIPFPTTNIQTISNASGNVQVDTTTGLTAFYYASMSGNLAANVIVTSSHAIGEHKQITLYLDQNDYPKVLQSLIVNGQTTVTSFIVAPPLKTTAGSYANVSVNPTRSIPLQENAASQLNPDTAVFPRYRYGQRTQANYNGTPNVLDIITCDLIRLVSSWRVFVRVNSIATMTPYGIGGLSFVFDTSNYRSLTSDEPINFTVPQGVTQISAVCIGGGGAGESYYYYSSFNPLSYYVQNSSGRGGDLRYGTFAVTPGETLTVTRGRPGFGVGRYGGESSIKRGSTVLLSAAGGGPGTATSGSSVGTGGNGGRGWQYPTNYSTSYASTQTPGGGGAGGYAGNGGDGYYNYNGTIYQATASATNGYAGGGGYSSRGGGVGNLGATENPTGTGGFNGTNAEGFWGAGGKGGRGVQQWGYGGLHTSSSTWGVGGVYTQYGTYGNNGYSSREEGYGGDGHVRLVWSSPSDTTRQYPATNLE